MICRRFFTVLSMKFVTLLVALAVAALLVGGQVPDSDGQCELDCWSKSMAAYHTTSTGLRNRSSPKKVDEDTQANM